MLHEPDIIVLDEATSALDPDSQDKLMKFLTDELKATTIVSVGHRPELEQFHDRKITLERRRGGAKLATDVELVPRPSSRKLLRRWLEHKRLGRRSKGSQGS
jgi:putative ATP-binding cassette transporter